MKGVTVIGAGGHAKVVIATLKAAGKKVACIYDDDPEKKGSSILKVKVKGPIPKKISGPAVIAIGDNLARKELAGKIGGARWTRVVHPKAIVHRTAKLGPGTVVFAGAIVQPDTRIGAHSIVNTGATVDHDCTLGDFVHVAPGCHLAGGVKADEGVFMGIGSWALPGTKVGAWTIVAAGAGVAQDLPDRVTAVGVPARHRM
jgi:sugar O-acyltransferase (sialic acid O-acetyltransferase NeuD family)